jgi:exosortase/archaeosortase family protein
VAIFHKGRQLALVPALVLTGAAIGVSGIVYFVGQGLAYISLAFGILFFAFAARYYIATISVLLTPGEKAVNGKNGNNGTKTTNGENRFPMISVHLALYNEERVADRLLTACSKLDYPNYEVVVIDDSKDGTVTILKDWILEQLKLEKPKFKIIHRLNREGFKGGALNEALKNTSPKAEYVVVFDADFVPPPDILNRFLTYFNKHGQNGNGNNNGQNGNGRYPNGALAAVQGYQWHTLNRAENWLTRGVSCEFSGSYMVDRTFQEVTGTMKMVAGSVYMIRADLLRKYGWSTSITEDWELTLRFYKDGYRVLYTPLIQAPAECPSTLGKLIRQRMRWAEGHTYNVKKYFLSVLSSSKLGIRQKLEFLYYAPYYLQSLFLILGTAFWLVSDFLFGTKLPYFTATFGWGLVFTNLLALPVMSLAGLFLEKRAGKDCPGILSQLVLIYALSPYQAYAALKGLLEPTEGSWVRTFKSGRVVGFPGKLEPRKVIKKMLPPRKRTSVRPSVTLTVVVLFGLSAVFVAVLARGQIAASWSSPPAYYFYNQPAPASYSPFSSTLANESFLMHLTIPPGPEAEVSVGEIEGSGPIFFSDPAPSNLTLPYGASVSVHVWVNATGVSPCSATSPLCTTTTTTTTTTCSIGDLEFSIGIYNPANNTIRYISGVSETQSVTLGPGVSYYQASWGNMAQNQMILKGETLVATFWCSDCKGSVLLLYNSPTHPSNIDFPIEVPENSISAAALALMVPGIAGLVLDYRKVSDSSPEKEAKEKGTRRVQRVLIVAAAIILLTLPLVMTFNDFLTSVVSSTGLERLISPIVPYEAAAVADLMRGFGLQAGSSSNSVWLGSGFIPVTALIDWNCAGWQGFVLFGLTSVPGLGQIPKNSGRVLVVLAGVSSVFAVNVLRIFLVVLLGYYVGYPAALVFHNYGGAIMTLVWLLVFWMFVLRRYENKER